LPFAFQESISITPIAQAFIPTGTQLYQKELHFDKLYAEIYNLEMSLNDANPDFEPENYELLVGNSGAKYLQTNKPMTANRNLLACAERDSEILSWQMYNKEGLITRKPKRVMLSDHFLIREDEITVVYIINLV
jgi:hypothetical protein